MKGHIVEAEGERWSMGGGSSDIGSGGCSYLL